MTQRENNRIFSVYFAFLFGVSLVLPLMGQAAELYLESSKNEYYTQETFIIDVRIDVEHNESINAIEAYFKFPNDILEAKDFSTGNSILTFIEEPKIDQGKGLISFVGIIPGGYGGRIPGDPGKSNLLGRIIFQAISSGSAKITFEDNSQTLLSDGKGTSAKLTTKGVIIEVQSPVEVQPQKDEWQEELEKDKISPEDFKPEIIKIDDKYYLAFTAKDKDSGIAYYVIRETRRKISLKRETDAKWVEAESPYVLKDQKLRSYIYVKAIDKAGNERIVVVEPRYPLKWYENWWIWVILIISIAYVIWRIIAKQKQNNTRNPEGKF